MNNLTNITNQADLTMSSREIAEVCEKQHQHVRRDIEKMLNNLNMDASTFGHIYRDARNREQEEYKLPKDLTMTLVTGYRDDLRFKVIKRVEELEAGAALAHFDIPKTLPDALRLAADQQDTILLLENQVNELVPSLEALNLIAEADGSMCITDAAKALQMRPKDLFAYLKMNGWIYRRNGTGHYLGYQPKAVQGLLEHKVTTVLKADGSEKITEQVRITPKGLTKLAKLLQPIAKVA